MIPRSEADRLVREAVKAERKRCAQWASFARNEGNPFTGYEAHAAGLTAARIQKSIISGEIPNPPTEESGT